MKKRPNNKHSLFGEAAIVANEQAATTFSNSRLPFKPSILHSSALRNEPTRNPIEPRLAKEIEVANAKHGRESKS